MEYFELDDPATTGSAELLPARPAPPQHERNIGEALMGHASNRAERSRCRLRLVLGAGLALCLGMSAVSLAWHNPHKATEIPGPHHHGMTEFVARPWRSDARWPPEGERQSLHISTDRPAYEPGDTLHAVCWLLGALNQEPYSKKASDEWMPPSIFHVTIKGPMDDTIESFTTDHSWSATQVVKWKVPGHAAGGEYKVIMKPNPPWSSSPDHVVGAPAERGFQVHVQRKKGLLLQLDFDREGYGPGETAQARLSAKRLNGEPVDEEAAVDVTARIDGVTVFQKNGLHFARGHAGELQVQVPLPTEPKSMTEGTLGATVVDGGVVETVSAALPLASQNIHVDVLPEGGDLVEGLRSRVYISARLPNGEPADIDASVVPVAAGSSAPCWEAKASAVATVRTVHEGRGVSSTFVPAAGASYRLCVLRPKLRPDHAATDLPKSIRSGATLSAAKRSFHFAEPLHFSMWATEVGAYVLRVYRREQELGMVQLNYTEPRKAHTIGLSVPSTSAADGVLRATLYRAMGPVKAQVPLAERLVWREPVEVLGLKVSAEPKRVEPGARVTLSVRSSTPNALVSVAVVDARARAGLPRRRRPFGLPEMAYLEDEVAELTDADAYLSEQPPSPALAQRLDLLLGVQGWRRFVYEDVPFFLDKGTASSARSRGSVPSEERRLRLLALGDAQPPIFFFGPGPVGAAEDDEMAMEKAAPMPPAMPMPEAAMAAPPPQMPQFKREFKKRMQKKRSEPANSSELLFWTGSGHTNASGLAVFTFNAPDVSASFEVLVDGAARGGRLGTSRGAASVIVGAALTVQPKLPAELTGGDRVWAPIALQLAQGAVAESEAQAKLLVSTSGGLALQGLGTGLNEEGIVGGKRKAEASPEMVSPLNFTLAMRPGTSHRVFAQLETLGSASNGSLTVQASLALPQNAAAPHSTSTQRLHIVPRGFPQKLSKGGMLSKEQSRASLAVPMPPDAVAGSTAVRVQLYLSPAARLDSALEALLQEPCGCFEQTSSTTYPVVMALQYFLAHPELSGGLMSRARDILSRGYKHLVSFQTKSGGFEWFGSEPAHEALTAYGVLQFHDMKSAMPGLVDDGMLGRAFDWLFGRRAGEGASSAAFLRSDRALDSFGRAPVVTTDAYIIYALVRAGHGSKLQLEVKVLLESCTPLDFRDPYVLSLAAGTLFHLGDTAQATALAKRVADLQAADGHVEGAKGSITSSRGNALAVEATAVSMLAWLDDPEVAFASNIELAIRWLAGRCERGRFGSTQATVLALKAIVAYEKWRASMTQWHGQVALLVDGETHATMDLAQQNAAEPVVLSAVAANSALQQAGNHSLELALLPAAGAASLSDDASLPFAMDVAWSSPVPPSSEACAVKVETSLSRTNFSEGALGELTVTVEAVSDEDLPMVVAIVGVPAGLEVEDEALRLLKAKGSVDFMERHGAAEIVFYWRGFKQGSKKALVVPFVAAVPGDYLGRASRAYLYYGDELKSWAPGLRALVTSASGG